MVHSIEREREREGRCAVTSDLYMPGSVTLSWHLYLATHSILINHLSLPACYHKGQHCYGTPPSILGWPQGYHWIIELIAVAALVAHPLDFSAVAYWGEIADRTVQELHN